jgi:ribosomal-protein-alanine N-acetyltransferase
MTRVYFYVDRMVEDDLEQVHAIDKVSFPVAWSLSTYQKELRATQSNRYVVARVSGVLPGEAGSHTGVRRMIERLWPVATSAPQRHPVVGHGGVWSVLDEGHITTIAVHPTYRRMGVGELILLGLIDQAYELDVHQLTLEVRVSNVAAQHLYAKYGFSCVNVRKRYYTDNNEDAMIMWTDDIRTPEYRQRASELRSQLYQRLQQHAHRNSPI